MINPTRRAYVMTFDTLLKLVASPDAEVNICCDSRSVKPGDVFVAVSGTIVDGHDFIDQAIANGAAYIVCEKNISPATDAETIKVENSARALGLIAQARYSDPAKKLVNLAVTGTNGKTTVCYLVRSIVQAAAKKCGLIGTITYDTGEGNEDAPLTTPDALQIAALTRKMVDAGCSFLAIEASSHALSQERLSGIDFKAAAFTNLTGDHLDYHKTTEQYLAAKTKLFESLGENATAVLNKQSDAAGKIAEKTQARVMYYAVDEPADISAAIESMDIRKTVYTLHLDGKEKRIETSLAGKHNISNQLAAAGLCHAAGFDIETIAAGLSSLKCVPGRLDSVNCEQNFDVFIDYAHTDDALSNVLSALRPLCKGRLIVLFGCGGDRDKTKRPRMAKVAEDFADDIIVTSDNPRTEDPDVIIKDVIAGFTAADNENITVEPDRKKAIAIAIGKAQKGDIVLLAGKGHEDYQVIGKTKIHFDDTLQAKEVLESMSCQK